MRLQPCFRAVESTVRSTAKSWAPAAVRKQPEIFCLMPLQVTLLPRGAFSNYVNRWQVEGAGLGYLKLSRINPPDEVLSLIGVPKVVVEAIPVTEAERAAAR